MLASDLSKARPAQVGVLASSPCTAERLRAYLTEAGLTVWTAHRPNRLSVLSAVQVLVIFPDDYGPGLLRTLFATAERADSRPHLVLVTGRPDRLGPLVRCWPPPPPVLLPRPAFSWTILDVLRGMLRTGPEQPL